MAIISLGEGVRVRQDWEPEDLIEVWTLLEDDTKKLRNKSGSNRLGFAMLLKFFEVEARFPESDKEVPIAAVAYVVQQVKVAADQWAAYDWQGRAATRHRAEIREAFGFRESTEQDQENLAEWLSAELCGVEMSRDRLAEAVVARCRNDHIEPPAPAKVRRLVAKATRDFDAKFCRRTVDRLSHATRSRLEDLLDPGEGEEEDGEASSVGGGRSFFTELKADPGVPGLESLFAEVDKLQRIRRLEMLADLFADVSEKQVDAWRARASKEYPANMARMHPPMRLTLLAALCHVRHTEITDSLVELFTQLVLKINTRAEKKVDKELTDELKKVRGKDAMMLRVAEASMAQPSGTVRQVIFPVVREKTMKALVAEAAANEAKYKARVRTVLRSAYSSHWRRMLTPLLRALTLKCNNTAYRPVMDAIDLLQRYLEQPIAKEGAFFDAAETVPLQ